MVYGGGGKAVENSICPRNWECIITCSLKKGEFLKGQHSKSGPIKLTYLFQTLVTVLYLKKTTFKRRMEMTDVTG